MQGFSSQLSHHRRKLIGFILAFSLYGLAGFLLLPWYLERQLLTITEDRLALSSSVESIYFNPFSFYFEINDFAFNNLDGTRLLKLSHFHADLQASRLLLLKAQLSDITLDGMELNFDRPNQTENTFTLMAQRWADSAAQLPSGESEESYENNTDYEALADEEPSANREPSASKELPLIEVLSLSIKNISANFTDNSLATPFSSTINVKTIQVDNLSTALNARSTNQISVDFEQQSQLDVSGTFGINPMQFQGTLSLENFPADIASRYAQDSLPALISSGRLGIRFNYAANLAEVVPEIVIDGIVAELQSLTITENHMPGPFIQLHSLAIANADVNIPENSIHLDSLTLDGLGLNASLNSNKQLNLIRIIESLTSSDPAPSQLEQPIATGSAETDAAPWNVGLDTFIIQDTVISIRDESLEQPFALASTVNGRIRDISTQANHRFPVELSLALSSGGDVLLGGEVQAIPELDLNGSVSVTGLDLSVLQPYINEFSFAQLQRGTLEMEAQLSASSSEPFAFQGGLSLRDLLASDPQLGEPLVAFDSLEIDSMIFSTAANSFEISEVALNSLFARVIINEDGSSNIVRSIKTTAADNTASEVNQDSGLSVAVQESGPAPLAITVGQVRVNNGSANFTDKNLPIVFNANISALSGIAEGFATNTSQPTNINLEGEVDEFGLVQINSVLTPFAVTKQSQIQVSFTNINMPAMTPYIIKFAGREIVQGNVDLILNYDLEDGELEANNQFILSDLKLGKRIEHPDAMDLPLDLALALLKDGKGVIDLEIPITGDVSDPEFNFGPAIRRALSNVLTNIVAAPFRFLGNLVGSGENSLESIRFLPGRTDIAAPEREVLVKLGEALQLRPQLMLEIPPVSAAQDSLALKTAAVNQKIDEALALTQDSEELLTTRRRNILEKLYLAFTQATPLTEIQLLHTTSAEAPEVALVSPASASPPLDILAYNSDLRRRLIDQEEISVTALKLLADARAKAVVDFLLSDEAISPQRIRITELRASDLDEGGWLSMVFELSSNN
jgi:hypothetical protein